MHAVRNTLGQRIIYPAMLLVAGVIAWIPLGYVVPRFRRISRNYVSQDRIPAAVADTHACWSVHR